MKNTLPSIIRLFIQLAMLFFAFLMLPENPVKPENKIVDSTSDKDAIFLNTESAFYRVTPKNFSLTSSHTISEHELLIKN